MSEKVDIDTDREMIRWAGIQYEGDDIPIQLQRLIWAARTQGARLAWRDVYQIASSQVENHSPRLPVVPPDVSSSASVTQSDGAQAAPTKSE
jgi:hypothetical protein